MIRALVLGASLSCAAGEAPAPPGEYPNYLQLAELFRAFFLLVSFVAVGIIWVGLIRRNFLKHTERIRQREAALEEHYRELFENAHDIIFTHDLDGNLISLNHAGEQILGYSRQEATRQNLASLVSPTSLELFREVLRRLNAGQSTSPFELEMRAKNGRRIVLRIDLRLQQLAGKPGRVQGIAWDITGQKEAEAALRESEERLRRSLEERVQLGRDLHDGIIQTIYAIGLGLGECRRLLEEDPKEAVGRLSQAITDLNTVIRDVRNFIVGLEPGPLEGRKFESALQSLIVTMSRTHAAQFSLAIDPGAADQLTTRQATHLLQIAREALSNSLRHAQAKHTVVSLTTRKRHIRLEVQDDGIGFDPATVVGTGYGLRNISARAQELGAASTIDSAPGKGTIVSVTVPANQTT